MKLSYDETRTAITELKDVLSKWNLTIEVTKDEELVVFHNYGPDITDVQVIYHGGPSISG